MISGSFEQGHRRLERSYTSKNLNSDVDSDTATREPVILSQSGVKRVLGTSMPMIPETPRAKNGGRDASSNSDSTSPTTSTTGVARGASRLTTYLPSPSPSPSPSLSPSPSPSPPSLKESTAGIVDNILILNIPYVIRF